MFGLLGNDIMIYRAAFAAKNFFFSRAAFCNLGLFMYTHKVSAGLPVHKIIRLTSAQLGLAGAWAKP